MASSIISENQVFNRLTTIERVKVNNYWHWTCECTCGNIVSVDESALRRGLTQSCGCLQKERKTKHGMVGSSEHGIWLGMKQRCSNPKATHYENYGGRGIIVCDEWKESFAAFFKDMGPRPEGTSIDRIDGTGNYEPSNCRWATQAEQARNKKSNILIPCNGTTLCMEDWADIIGITSGSLKKRLNKMSIGEALTKPITPQKRMVTFEGKTQSIQDWCTELGMAHATLANRFRNGWSIEDALTKPVQKKKTA
jgi:hypothetical protein